jgi:hypothetical protein
MIRRIKKETAPRPGVGALFFVGLFVTAGLLGLGSCASGDLPGLSAAPVPADGGIGLDAALAQPGHFAELTDQGFAVIHFDATGLSSASLSAALGRGRIPAALAVGLLKQGIAIIPPASFGRGSDATGSGESGPFLAYVSAGIPSGILEDALAQAGFLPAPRFFGAMRRPRWELPSEVGPPLVLELSEAGLYRISRGFDDSAADGILVTLREQALSSGEENPGAANDRVALGVGRGADSPLFDFFGGQLIGIRGIEFVLSHPEPKGSPAGGAESPFAGPEALNITLRMESSSALQARALRGLLRIALLALARDIYPDADAGALRDEIDIESEGPYLILRDFPVDPAWIARRFLPRE